MARNTGGASFKVGRVQEARPGFARVRFEDLSDDGDPFVSAWLPVVASKTKRDKQGKTLDIDEHVACVLDDLFEDGVVLGAIYSDDDAAPNDSADVICWVMADGAVMSYDRASGAMRVKPIGSLTVEAGADVMIKSPSTVTIDVPDATFTGNLLVQGALVYQGGMSGSGGSGGGASATISGGISVDGDIAATGSILDGGGNSNHHTHPGL